MATTTPNYGLRKPTNADTVNVATDISANMDLIDAHAHSGTYVATVGVSSGTDDTAAINALLAANLNVKGLPGQTYIISTPLIIRSGSTLDMTGCTINLKAGSNCQMIYNQAYTAARRLVDGAITAAATTLTSATATFVAGDVGKTVFIWGAGQQGEILRTTITARTNGTTVTVADAALSTVTGQRRPPRLRHHHYRRDLGSGQQRPRGGQPDRPVDPVPKLRQPHPHKHEG